MGLEIGSVFNINIDFVFLEVSQVFHHSFFLSLHLTSHSPETLLLPLSLLRFKAQDFYIFDISFTNDSNVRVYNYSCHGYPSGSQAVT